jgi:hypothetical protein
MEIWLAAKALLVVEQAAVIQVTISHPKRWQMSATHPSFIAAQHLGAVLCIKP